MQTLKENLTYHVKVQRADRLQSIENNIGIGQVVKEKYFRSWDRVEAGRGGVYLCITDTGVTIIKDELKQNIITIYVTTYRELLAVYGNASKIPPYLRKKVDRNQSHYIVKGKTKFKKG